MTSVNTEGFVEAEMMPRAIGTSRTSWGQAGDGLAQKTVTVAQVYLNSDGPEK